MGTTFQADKETVERVVKMDKSIQHWAMQLVQLEFQRVGILETIQSLSSAKAQTVRSAVEAAGIPLDKVAGASLNTSDGSVEVTMKEAPPVQE